jgi:hypothetical protein
VQVSVDVPLFVLYFRADEASRLWRRRGIRRRAAVFIDGGNFAGILAIFRFQAIHCIDQSHAGLDLPGNHFKHIFDSFRNIFGGIFDQSTLLVALPAPLRLIQRNAGSNDEQSVDDASNEISRVGESPETDEKEHKQDEKHGA